MTNLEILLLERERLRGIVDALASHDNAQIAYLSSVSGYESQLHAVNLAIQELSPGREVHLKSLRLKTLLSAALAELTEALEYDGYYLDGSNHDALCLQRQLTTDIDTLDRVHASLRDKREREWLDG